MKVVFCLWRYMMVDDESRKWQVWHGFVKRGSYFENENTNAAKQQHPAYLDLHQQWLPNNEKTKDKSSKNEPHKTGHPQTNKKLLDASRDVFFWGSRFPIVADCLILWMDEVLWVWEFAVLGTQEQTVDCGNSYQVHTWKCNSWDRSAVGHVLFHKYVYR